MKRSALLFLATLSWGLAGQASALPIIEFLALDAKFENAVAPNPVPADVMFSPAGFDDPTEVTWGAGGNRSGYEFDSRDTPFIEPPNVLIDLGEFIHTNEPINGGSSITSVDLVLRADIEVTNSGGMTGQFLNQMFTFSLMHNETTNFPPNDQDCANGEENEQGVNINGCADIVTVDGLPDALELVVDGETFLLEFVGFDIDFETMEEGMNDAPLLATFRAVPEPGTLALLGLSLVGLGFVRRRR